MNRLPRLEIRQPNYNAKIFISAKISVILQEATAATFASFRMFRFRKCCFKQS
jgi:hypothetical protein